MSAFTVRPATHKEIEALGFSALLKKPGFRPSLMRLGVLQKEGKSRITSRLLIEQLTLQYGSVFLRVAGISGAYTEFRFRGEGYAEQVMQDGLAYVREQGAHLALLNDTTGGYFRRFGFGSVWPQYYMTFSAQSAQKLSSPYRVRPAEHQDLPHMAHLYDQYWSSRVAPFRAPALWMWRARRGDWQGWVAVDPDGAIHGYVATSDLMSGRVEIVAEDSAAAFALIAEAGRQHQEAGHDLIRWPVPPDDALIAYTRPYMELTLSANYTPESGWMARVIDAGGLLQAVMPELTAQGKAFIPGFDAENLFANYNTDTVKIGLNDDPATHVRIGYHEFIQVLFASLTPDALGLRHHLRHETVDLLRALFPARVAALAAWDWF